MSSVQSVTLEPMGSCEDALALLSQPLQSNNELMSCKCMSFICLCVRYCVDLFAHTRSDSA